VLRRAPAQLGVAVAEEGLGVELCGRGGGRVGHALILPARLHGSLWGGALQPAAGNPPGGYGLGREATRTGALLDRSTVAVVLRPKTSVKG
jgi:hypothetical protein